MKKQEKTPSNAKLLMKYAGFAMQAMIGLSIAFYAGFKLDEWLQFSFPVLVWILPLLAIIAMIWQVIKDTSKNK